jgi:4-hydroxy-tetrahydrodipicolinate synthase
MNISGVWLPIVTPMKNGGIDYDSYRGLVRHYLSSDIAGMIPLGTTGESPTVKDDEFEQILAVTQEEVGGRLPVYVGAGGNDTGTVLAKLAKAEAMAADGILSVCPYYNRPSQQGMYAHFRRIAEATDLPIIIYNIPYRTGVNLANETLLRLAEIPNIIGVKDSCGVIQQSLRLLAAKPDGFSVLTGEDALFYTSVVNGADGGILASAHLQTRQFVKVFELLQGNDHQAALKIWRGLEHFIPDLFTEPNPAPLKYCLYRLGQIATREVRLPLVPVSDELKARLDERLSGWECG